MLHCVQEMQSKMPGSIGSIGSVRHQWVVADQIALYMNCAHMLQILQAKLPNLGKRPGRDGRSVGDHLNGSWFCYVLFPHIQNKSQMLVGWRTGAGFTEIACARQLYWLSDRMTMKQRFNFVAVIDVRCSPRTSVLTSVKILSIHISSKPLNHRHSQIDVCISLKVSLPSCFATKGHFPGAGSISVPPSARPPVSWFFVQHGSTKGWMLFCQCPFAQKHENDWKYIYI